MINIGVHSPQSLLTLTFCWAISDCNYRIENCRTYGCRSISHWVFCVCVFFGQKCRGWIAGSHGSVIFFKFSAKSTNLFHQEWTHILSPVNRGSFSSIAPKPWVLASFLDISNFTSNISLFLPFPWSSVMFYFVGKGRWMRFHSWCQGLNLGGLCARQEPHPLCYCSSSSNNFWLEHTAG